MFWREKFEQNVARDQRVVKELRSKGWVVVTIWECDVEIEPAKVRRALDQTLAKRAS
jgi:DNA mismatch endonuclease (patch repair protein)